MALHERYVELFKLRKDYPAASGRGTVTIVEDFTLNMKQGEFVSVIGHSGCGKSTVLMMLAGLTEKTSGNIVIAGKESRGPGPDRGIVFQSPSLLPWMTAEENVTLGIGQVRPDLTARQRRDVAREYLTLVGLGSAIHKCPAEMSGGMRQRVGIARAFALKPNMLLLDEPFGMLDQLTRMDLQDTLIELCNVHRTTTLMVTHDVDEALYLSDRIVMMTSGPRATIGKVMAVTFPRPRVRTEVLEHSDYYPLREQMIDFLESYEAQHPHEEKKPSVTQNSAKLEHPKLEPVS